ncbi:hypothetical protein, partial [Silvimonas sp.]|uniref:hypothetical protein n=1 Tax=Silvimonas sp. TaxID=2650811 RepID=UPI002844F413
PLLGGLSGSYRDRLLQMVMMISAVITYEQRRDQEWQIGCSRINRFRTWSLNRGGRPAQYDRV